ncbi:hypothetical protein EWB00_000454, partial [Schistosoma japonicum]
PLREESGRDSQAKNPAEYKPALLLTVAVPGHQVECSRFFENLNPMGNSISVRATLCASLNTCASLQFSRPPMGHTDLRTGCNVGAFASANK